ncbi:MAG: hypothetical protein INR63_32445 [Actinomycetospora chiangmaiensis]|nr:hypothetical protein [Actinomycetospora chiangmaiensis]
MPLATQIITEGDLSAGRQAVDWGVDSTGISCVGEGINGNTTYYRANGAAVVVNDNGVAVSAEDTTSMDVNFPVGSSMLVAVDPPPKTMPDVAPIKLRFFNPVREVGAYVTVSGPMNELRQKTLHAIIWLQFQGDPSWVTSFSANGPIGTNTPAGQPFTAAFLGARASGAPIEGVKIDGKLIGKRSFPFLVLSNLFWVA